MSKYIFHVTAINTVPEAVGGAYKDSPVVIDAKDIDDALDKAQERWKPNKQFRFEWHYAGKD